MKKLLSIIILILSACILCQAQTHLQGSQLQAAITKINNAAAGMKSMSCSFVQTKHIKLLNDKMVSKGTMNYKQTDKLRWEYTSPYKYLFIFNGSKVYVGNSSRKDVIDTKSNKVFKEVARIMMNTVTGKALSKKDDFSVSVVSTNSAWQVTLVPVKKDLKQMFSKVILVFNKANTMISEINIYEKNGDWSNIKLTGVTYNGAINEKLFAIP
ncbi:MAG: outer membrane lipoprotein carrier protein LolA [Muribaculaceae bacterium]|nr:outer membrane lipoprotein carrier protein LolA [Muribaculaceae bacterium]